MYIDCPTDFTVYEYIPIILFLVKTVNQLLVTFLRYHYYLNKNSKVWARLHCPWFNYCTVYIVVFLSPFRADTKIGVQGLIFFLPIIVMLLHSKRIELYQHFIWTVHELYMDCTWTVLELYLNHTWTIPRVFVKFMYCSCTIYFGAYVLFLKRVLHFWKRCRMHDFLKITVSVCTSCTVLYCTTIQYYVVCSM